MVVKKLIGKLVVALIRALVRAFFGMLIGIALIGFILVMLLFFGVLMPDASNEIVIFEIAGLLLVGAGIGAIVGFFDMLDFGSKASAQQRTGKNIGNNLRHDSGGNKAQR